MASASRKQQTTKDSEDLPTLDDAIGLNQCKDESEYNAARVKKAKENAEKDRVEKLPISTPSFELGKRLGPGIGLHFQVTRWMTMIFAAMTIVTVPFMFAFALAYFTDKDHLDNSQYGLSLYTRNQDMVRVTFAGLLDDRVDGGMLSWMRFKKLSIDVANLYRKVKMKRSHFLTYMSVVDAGCTFSLFCIALFLIWYAEKWSERVDKETIEVCDYSVLVMDILPDITASEIGEHFGRWGRVIDVTVISNVSHLLKYCTRATELHAQHMQMSFQTLKQKGKIDLKDDSETKVIDTVMESIDKLQNQSSLNRKIAFVTFNDMRHRKACLKATPHSFPGSWLLRRKHWIAHRSRFWVHTACPPEDYIYEHLDFPGSKKRARQVFIAAVVATFLIIAGLVIEALASYDSETDKKVFWDKTKLNQSILMARSTLSHDLQQEGVNMTGVPYAQNDTSTGLCGLGLETICTGYLRGLLQGVKLNATVQGVSWPTLTDGLIYEDVAFKIMEQCWKGFCIQGFVPDYCYPCHCYGKYLYGPKSYPTRSAARIETRHCDNFLEGADYVTTAIRSAISLVITALNAVIDYVLRYLVRWEKHYSKSGEEYTYSLYSFSATLLNTVLVIMLVNAKVRVNSNNAAAAKANQHVLNGPYGDFSQGWYEDVGRSLTVVLFINAIMPLVTAFSPFVIKKFSQWQLRVGIVKGTEQNYDKAFSLLNFELATRISPMLLAITMTMLFGSGIPVVYIAACVLFLLTDMADRYALLRLSKKPVRYKGRLPMLILQLLPIAAIIHAAIGLWMHTLFKTQSRHELFKAAATAASRSGSFTAGADVNTTSFTNLGSSSVGQRISQSNGIPLLTAFVVMVLVYIVRFVLRYSFMARVVEACQWLARACCFCCFEGNQDEDLDPTYTEALTNHPVLLQGIRTYQLHHHPMYRDTLMKPVAGLIYSKALGQARFTRLRFNKSGEVLVLDEPLMHRRGSLSQRTIKAYITGKRGSVRGSISLQPGAPTQDTWSIPANINTEASSSSAAYIHSHHAGSHHDAAIGDFEDIQALTETELQLLDELEQQLADEENPEELYEEIGLDEQTEEPSPNAHSEHTRNSKLS